MEKWGGEGDAAVDHFNLADREELSSYRRGFKGYYPILASAPFICDVKVCRANNLWIIIFQNVSISKSIYYYWDLLSMFPEWRRA